MKGPKLNKNLILDANRLRALQAPTEGKTEDNKNAMNSSNQQLEQKASISVLRPMKKKIVFTETELIQETCGIERIQYFLLNL